jgi:heme/copper-type cytochrome/quinol oxidase subunit 2
VAYALVLSLPFARMSDKVWRKFYVLLVAFSGLFVFVMVAVVLFAYMAADARGERLGVPGFEGTLIFMALLQVPVVLFQRKPDLLD